MKKWDHRCLRCLLSLVVVMVMWMAGGIAALGQPGEEMIFPDDPWQKIEARDQGFDPQILDEIMNLMKKAEANGLLIRNGCVVAEWYYGGSKDKQFETQSITKSFTSLVLGLTLDDSTIPSLDNPVKEIFPAFEAGSFSEVITFRHLVTMTSGIKPSRYQFHFKKELPPGVILNYHADQCAHLARALTYVNEKTMFSLLKERILDPIGAKGQWGIDKEPWSPVRTKAGKDIPVNVGFAFFYISAPDLARVGHMFLNAGRWKDEQLLSTDYVNECWKEISLKPIRRSHWGDGYGLYWWRLAPGVWYMSGTGNQFCMVWPKYGIVMTKLNDLHNNKAGLRDIYPLLYRSMTGKNFVVPLEWTLTRRRSKSSIIGRAHVLTHSRSVDDRTGCNEDRCHHRVSGPVDDTRRYSNHGQLFNQFGIRNRPLW